MINQLLNFIMVNQDYQQMLIIMVKRIRFLKNKIKFRLKKPKKDPFFAYYFNMKEAEQSTTAGTCLVQV